MGKKQSTFIDLAGQVFTRWTVLKIVEPYVGSKTKWTCLCICGTVRDVLQNNLLKNTSKSCGCLTLEKLKERNANQAPSPPRPKEDLVGRVYNRLTVLSMLPNRNSRGLIEWLLQCSCGNTTVLTSGTFKNGTTTSCGCYAREILAKRSTTHGMRHTPEWHIWAQFIGRCTNPRNKGYKNYGGRGITIEDPRWFHFQHFIDDVGLRPSPELSLDRINNERGYCKENIAWRTRKDQSRNRRNRIWLEYNGEKRILSDWCETLELPYPVMRNRIVKRGLSPKEAFETPIRSQSNRNSSRRKVEDNPLNDRKQ